MKFLPLMLLLVGCIPPQHPKNAEVTVPVPAAKAKECALSFLVSQGWRPVRSDDLVMTFQKQGTGYDMLVLADHGGAKHELTLTFMDQTNSVRVLGFGARIVDRFGGQKNLSHLDISPGVQWHLDSIRASCIGEPMPQLPPKPPPAKTTKAGGKG